MAKSADEYKEELLRNLAGTANMADRSKAFLLREIEFAETPAIRETMQDKIETYDALAEFSRAAALVLEDVETAY